MATDHDKTAGHRPKKLGHYETVEEIGRGGMAVVYKGVQPSLNRTVAIKVLPSRLARTPELVERFDREANIAAQLKHPNIVQVIDRGKERNTLFIVMEYVEGKSLDRLIKERKLTIPETIHYSMQICDALEYAHGQGVIHRDLKPSNILIYTQTDRAMIADFGIAQIDTSGTGLSTLTTQDAALGTMNYMSPEQRVDSHMVTYHTDIFSFGVLLYEMLTGKLPIGHFKDPSLIRRDVPIGFDRIVQKCLAEAVADRYQSAADIKADLGRITARHATIERAAALTRKLPRNRKALYIAGGGAAALIVGIVALLVLRSPDRTPGPTPAPRLSSGTATWPKPAPAPGLALNPARLKAHFSRAQGLINGGKYKNGIALLRDIIARGGNAPIVIKARFALADVYKKMHEHHKAIVAYDNVVKRHPRSQRVPEALLAKCRIEWQTAPQHGLIKKKYSAAVQEHLADELKKIVKRYPQSKSATDALRLIADICQKPELNDWETAAESLVSLYERDRSSGPDSIYRAAELYDKYVGDKNHAITAYERFIRDFPDDERVHPVKLRLIEFR